MAQLDLLHDTVLAEESAAPVVVSSPSREKSPEALRTITEVAAELGEETHVLRFWETKFDALQPVKMKGNRRYYRPSDVVLLRTIRTLLHERGYTIKGAQALIAAHKNPLEALNTHPLDDAPVLRQTPAQEAIAALEIAAKFPNEKTRKTLEIALAELQQMRSILHSFR